MTTNYQTLLTLNLRHDYFTSQKFGEFSLTPDATTAQYLQRRGMLLKRNADEVLLLMENGVDPEQKIEQVYNEQQTLRFSLIITDPYFFNYTDNLPEQINENIFYFSNSTKNGSYKAYDSNLHLGECVTAKDALPLKQFANQFLIKPFAFIDIQLNKGMFTRLFINFQSKATYWKYLITSNHLMELEQSAIISDGNETFSGPETIRLPNQRQAISFQSDKPIKLSQSTNAKLSLVENYISGSGGYRVVMRRLPVPDVRFLSFSSSTTSQLNLSEIFI